MVIPGELPGELLWRSEAPMLLPFHGSDGEYVAAVFRVDRAARPFILTRAGWRKINRFSEAAAAILLDYGEAMRELAERRGRELARLHDLLAPVLKAADEKDAADDAARLADRKALPAAAHRRDVAEAQIHNAVFDLYDALKAQAPG